MGALTKDEIMAAPAATPVCVPAPEWGGDVYVLPLSGDGRDQYDQIVQERQYPTDEHGELVEGDWRGVRAWLCAMTLCDEQGQLHGYTELEVQALGRKHGAVLDRVFTAARNASGLGVAARKAAEKNSPAGPSSNSGSS